MKLNTGKSWAYAIIAIIGGFLVSVSCNKVAPVMDILQESLGATLTQVSLLTTLMTLAGAVMTLVAGPLTMKMGARYGSFTAFLIVGLSGFLGMCANEIGLLLASRFIEGIGFGLLVTANPTLLNILFPPDKRGLPMGIWSCWIGGGMLIAFNLATLIVPSFGWRGYWCVISIALLVLAIIFLLVVRIPKDAVPEGEEEFDPNAPKAKISEALVIPDVWGMMIVFFAMSFVVTNAGVFMPTYLMDMGFDFGAANSIASLQTPGMIVCAILIGFVMNKMKNSWPLLPISMALLTIVAALLFVQSGSGVFIFIAGCIMGLVAPICFTNIASLASKPTLVAVCVAVMGFGDQIGGVVAPVITAQIVETSGYSMPLWTVMAIIPAIGFVCALLVSIRQTRKMKKRVSAEEEAA